MIPDEAVEAAAKWHTHCGIPAVSLRVGRRVHRAYGDTKTHGTIQSVDIETGMVRVWWDGHPCPDHSPTRATNIGAIVVERLV